MNTFNVRIWDIGTCTIRGKKWYRVRWTVEGGAKDPFEKRFDKKALADNERNALKAAANAGKAFDCETGRPVDDMRARNTTTWYAHARKYIEQKWPRQAANSRRGTVETLVAVTMLTLRPDRRGKPDDKVLRRALTLYGYNPRNWNDEKVPEDFANALAWVEKASKPVVSFDGVTVRRILEGLCLRLDGEPAAAATVHRKRANFYNALGFAVEAGLLTTNPIDDIQWTAPEVAEAIDRGVVVNSEQAEALLDAVRSFGPRADGLTAFYGCAYYCGTRPSEAADVHKTNLALPGTCNRCGLHMDNVLDPPPSDCDHTSEEAIDSIEYEWGLLTLVETEPRAGSNWTNDGRPTERRGLKRRARKATRLVPVEPEQARLFHRHVIVHGVAPDGRLFRGLHGGALSPSTWDRWWKMAREKALTPEQVASPLARRVYDLRHAAASHMLNNGVDAPTVARRLGHSVPQLLKTYANCIDGKDDEHNQRISAARKRPTRPKQAERAEEGPAVT